MNEILKSTHPGQLNIGSNVLDVAVLENGQRIITQNSVFKALGRPSRGNARAINVPVFMDAANLQPFIGEDLRGVINKIDYVDKEGKKGIGYDATILPLVCDLYLKAREEGAIKLPNQKATAQQAEILVRSLAKVGIIALVDEATGYQYEREKIELQAILKAFISDEIRDWQKTFELSFYKEIFRLWGIPFTAANIKRKPMFIGKLTNELVYKNMPKGYLVLDKLKAKTPKTDGGNYRYRLHQSLTPEAGRTALIKVINSVEALASISDTKAKFLRLMKDKYNPDMQMKLFPEIDQLAEKEDKKLPIPVTTFNKQLKGLLNVPPPKKN